MSPKPLPRRRRVRPLSTRWPIQLLRPLRLCKGRTFSGRSLSSMNPKSIGQFIIIGLVAGGAYYFYGQVHGAATVNVTPRDPLLSGLVGHWTFDGPDMTQNVADASGQGNTGYLTLGASGYTATTTAIGKLGQALEFDGDNDSIDAGSSVSINSITNATVAVWVKPDSTSNFYSIISNARDCCGSYKGIELELYNTGKFRWVIWGTDSLPRNVFSLTSATAGLWQHVVGTYDGTSLKIYMNGEFEQSTAYTGSIGIPASYNLNIGEMGHSSSVWNFD
ncbi:MAG: hypothetical protein COX54_01900, partial [Candidatus Yonathbacteria bacterium CG23_combo_of_CG06-09_8_20_14_all_46_18]